MPHAGLTPPLWCLLGLVVWTVGLLVALTVARFRHLAAGGSVREFGIPDDRRLVWRLYRAHLNALENLPLFVAVVLAAAAAGVRSPTVDLLAVVYVAARLAHSIAHVSPGAGLKWNLRLVFLTLQIACVLGLVAAIVAAA
jgi:uncharacterized MAPEG superfamily protein